MRIAADEWRNGLADPSAGRTGVAFAGMAAAWLLILGLLGLGSRYLNRHSPALKYLAEGSYAVYILHQTVIVIIAYFVVQTGLAIPFKYGITVVASFAVIVILYELLVSRIGVLRFLFGMRGKVAAPKPRRVVAPAT